MMGTMDTNGYTSKLEHGRQRFLVYAIEHALQIGRRTPEDFIRHFPPRTIMEALSVRPDLRAGVLVPTTGLKQRIALKKSWQSAGDDLQSALDEGETKPVQIVDAFAPDDRVLYLQDKKIWAFIVEGQFWKVTPKEDKAAFATAQQHIAYLLERALLDGLITPRDVVDGIGVNELCNRLPRSEMAALFTAALEGGRKGKAFTDRDLLATLPPSTLVQHVPLPHIYETVLHARVASVHGYLPEEKPAIEEKPPQANTETKTETKAETASEAKPEEANNGTATAAAAAPAPEAAPSADAPPPEAPAAEAAAEVKPESKGNGSRRRSKAPPAETQMTVEEDPEWIEIPESKH
jgi:hypothetical protein